MSEDSRNPDSDFVLRGSKTAIISRTSPVLSNSQKTLTSKNLSQSLNMSEKIESTSVDDLEHSLNMLKLELKQLNDSLGENYNRSDIYARDANYLEAPEIKQYRLHNLDSKGNSDEDAELTKLMQRTDEEAVSHLPPDDSTWFRDPKHLTEPLGDFPTAKSLGISTRRVSPRNRPPGQYGSEIVTKDIYGNLNHIDLAANDQTFPVRLTAPHIVGIRALLPPKYEVRMQEPKRSSSPVRSRTKRPRTATHPTMSSQKPAWMPPTWRPNYSAKTPPPLKTRKSRSLSRGRPSTALGIRNCDKSYNPANYTLSADGGSTIKRQVRALPTETELSFLKTADEIDTRRALVDNSPYQQELARLRMERLRVEEDYLLQLKRDSELERVRGPKPHWYEISGPEFHYECNKNTALHKNKNKWSETLHYRDQLLQASREFAATNVY